MRIVVMKFGGTSVANEAARQQILQKVKTARQRGNSPVVVVSAMGRAPEPYATDTLLSLVEDFSAFRDAGELDQLMACGEVISCVVLAHTLRCSGQKSRAFDGRQAGILTSDDAGNGRIRNIEPEQLLAYIHGGGIPVVAGFQGVNSEGNVTTLGRGGSDTSAVALGAALRAHYVEIYTDVDGVMTADPRVYSEAEILQQINFEEIGELASEGAKVVHPRAIELADEHGVPVWVRNTMNEGAGTFMARAVPRQAYERDRVITGIAHIFRMTGLVMDVSDRGAQVDLLRRLAQEDVNLDLINVTPDRLYAILPTEVFHQKGEPVLNAMGIKFEVRHECAKLSIVGAGMRGTPGVMAQIMGCLHEAGVSVIHSTDSNITISLLIKEEEVGHAVEALHEHFLSRTH